MIVGGWCEGEWGVGSWDVGHGMESALCDGGFNTFKPVTQNYRLLCDVFTIFWYF